MSNFKELPPDKKKKIIDELEEEIKQANNTVKFHREQILSIKTNIIKTEAVLQFLKENL